MRIEPADPFELRVVFADGAFEVDVAHAEAGGQTGKRAVIRVGLTLEHDVIRGLFQDFEVARVCAEEEITRETGLFD